MFMFNILNLLSKKTVLCCAGRLCVYSLSNEMSDEVKCLIAE